jgi:hypothetical protein
LSIHLARRRQEGPAVPLPGPDTRVVELRVPGLIGTSGESLLDAESTVEVAGDGIGKLVRPADRLRRPAPGPVLQALGRSLPRILEGYLWSGMTSGGALKATWALLFPFSLANVAHWMLPPVPQGSRACAWLHAACRGVLRVAALLLTMLLVSQLAVACLDLLAAQCLAPGSGCLPAVPSRLREFAPFRTAVGFVPVLAVIVVLYRVSATDWPVSADEETPQGDLLPGDLLREEPGIGALRCLHAVTALACLAVLPLGGPFRMPATGVDTALWAAALALLLLALVATAVRALRLGRRSQRALLGLAGLVVLAVAVRRTPLPATLSGTGLAGPGAPAGTDGTVEAIGAALVGASVLLGLLLLPAALLARKAWRDQPKRLRPWAGGWAAAPAFMLAGLLGGGFGAGLAVVLRRLLGTPSLRLPETYTLVTILWGGGLVVGAGLALLGFTVAVPMRRRARGVPGIVRMLQSGPRDERAAAAAWARSAWERRHLHHLALAVTATLSLGVAALLLLRYGFHRLPDWLTALSGLGVLTLGGLAAGLLRVIYTAATKPGRSRHLGALADLVCFWPRAAHPTVPPCYPLKVVPELTARAREHLTEPNTRVVLAGYSIGSLLAVMSAARLVRTLPESERDRVGLVTAGSPLQWGYQRAFPAVLPQRELAALYAALDGRWRGLCRGTDVFGGGVTTWRHQVASGKLLGVGYLPDGRIGPLPAASEGPTGALVLGGDHWLPDPLRLPSVTHRWAAGVLGHADYVVDPEWDRAVAMAAGLERPARPSRPRDEQVALFPDLPALPPPRFRPDQRPAHEAP